LTWTEGDSNVTNLQNATVTLKAGTGGTDVVSDLNGTVTLVAGTNVTLSGDNTAKTVTINASGGGGGISNVVEDTTPQLGGNLDVNGQSIVSASNGDIAITPNGTGAVILDGNEFPQTQGATGQILVADGAGLLEWANQEKLTAKVINADSVTINKGEPVYVFSAQGDLIAVKRALNTGDSTSAQTLGLATASIAANAEGIIICQGVLTHVDTSTYTAGQALYLGATAGSVTTTKPSEPNHLVYLGFVEKINASSGRIYVRVQNGYELDELHDVNINNATALANNHLLRYNSASTRWENAALDIITDTTPQLGGSLDVNGQSIVSVSNGNITLAPNGTGKVIISGDLQIDGTTTTVNSTTLDIDDINITLAKGAANAAAANGGGITLEGPTVAATITYTSANDRWNMNKTLAATLVGNVTGNLTGNADTATGATNINISTTDGNTSDTTLYPVLVGAASTGNQLPHIDSGVLTFNASTNILSSTGFAGALNGTVGATTANTGAFTTLSASSTVSGTGFSTYLASPPAIGGTAAAAGTFTALTSTGLTTLKTYKETISAGGNQASAYTPDYSLGTVHTVTLTGNVTFAAPTNMAAGNSLTLILTQDATGGRTGTWNASYKWLGGTPTLSTTAASIDVVNIFYDGTNYITGISKQDTSTSVSGLTITAAGELRLADTDSSNYVGFKAPGTVSANNIWTLPATDGTNGQVLSTNGSDVLSWITPGGGGASVAVVSQDALKGTLISGSTYRQSITEVSDPSSIITVTSNQFTVAAGTYIVEFIGLNKCTTVGAIFQHALYNVTGAAIMDNFPGVLLSDGSSATRHIFHWSYVVTPASSNTYEFRTLLDTTGDTVSIIGSTTFRITKIG
jgi:hypothetical protein